MLLDVLPLAACLLALPLPARTPPHHGIQEQLDNSQQQDPRQCTAAPATGMAAFQSAGLFDDVPRDIYNGTELCRRSLRDCQAIEALMKHGWAENRLADFNLWAAGVGASAPTQASLDWRLHFQPTARIVLTNLLVTLREFVEQCKELGLASDGSGDPSAVGPSDVEDTAAAHVSNWANEASSNNVDATAAKSSWFDRLGSASTDDESSVDSSEGSDDNPSTALGEAMGHTEDILDQLIRLGLAIRKSGTSARLRKADGLFKEDEHQDLRRHLSLGLLLQAGKRQDNQDKTTGERVIDPDKCYGQLSPEQKHLITANLLRRNRFVYARRHQRKLEGSLNIKTVVLETKPSARVIETPKPATPSRALRHSAETVKEEQPGDDTPKTAPEMTITTASVAEGDVLKATATYSQAASQVSVTTAKLSYPSPPPVAEGKRSFKCPCCYQSLPIMFRERARWRYVGPVPTECVGMKLTDTTPKKAPRRRPGPIHVPLQQLHQCWRVVRHQADLENPHQHETWRVSILGMSALSGHTGLFHRRRIRHPHTSMSWGYHRRSTAPSLKGLVLQNNSSRHRVLSNLSRVNAGSRGPS